MNEHLVSTQAKCKRQNDSGEAHVTLASTDGRTGIDVENV